VFKTRLDWILISRELRFPQYEVLPERLSDHFATRATILLK
jgi:endonuclease/exonuclease/phosphatase family metal-dependent hydrolase